MTESVYVREINPATDVHRPHNENLDLRPMKSLFFSAIISLMFLSLQAAGQSTNRIEPTPTPVHLVVTDMMPPVKASAPVIKTTRERVIGDESNQLHGPSPVSPAAPAASNSFAPAGSFNTAAAAGLKMMSFGQIKSKIAEAKREMQAR